MMADAPSPSPPVEYDFTLTLDGVANLDQPVTDALFEAGCDDATPCLRSGVVALLFARPAPDIKTAILSAIRDVQRAGIGAEVTRVDLHADEPAATRTIGVINSVLDYRRQRAVDQTLAEEVWEALCQTV